MTLDDAVREAFGRTSYIRRQSWPRGSGGAVDYRPGNESKLNWFTFGTGNRLVTPNDEDLDAEDWHPCTISAEPVVEDWRNALSIRRGDETLSIGRGDRCKVSLDGHELHGECTLAWAVPDRITLAVTGGSVARWPDDGILIPLGRLVVSANDIALPFHLLESSCWFPCEGLRLYHFVVVRSDETSSVSV